MMALPHKWLLLFGVILGFVSVAAGAFGAHALKQRITHEMLLAFEVGARYQMYHALAIGLSVWVASVIPGVLAPLSGWLFVVGTLLFSGSLYLMTLTGLRAVGAITPIGGVVLLAGWLCLALAIARS